MNCHIFKKRGGRKSFFCGPISEKNYFGCERPPTRHHANFSPIWPITRPLTYVYMLQNFNLEYLKTAFLRTYFTPSGYSRSWTDTGIYTNDFFEQFYIPFGFYWKDLDFSKNFGNYKGVFPRVYGRYTTELWRTTLEIIGQNHDFYSIESEVPKLLMNSRYNLHMWKEQFQSITGREFGWFSSKYLNNYLPLPSKDLLK